MFKQRDKGKDKNKDKEANARKNSSGSESSLSQSSVSSSPKPSAKNTKNNLIGGDTKSTGKLQIESRRARNWKVCYGEVDFFVCLRGHLKEGNILPYVKHETLNPLTPISDQDRIFPYNINAISTR